MSLFGKNTSLDGMVDDASSFARRIAKGFFLVLLVGAIALAVLFGALQLIPYASKYLELYFTTQEIGKVLVLSSMACAISVVIYAIKK